MHANRRDAAAGLTATPIVLLFGANLGDREAALRTAERDLEGIGIVWEAVSALYETEPVGVADQPWFLNRAARGLTDLSPHELLAACKAVERRAGRTAGERFGPRPLDIDILLYGRRVIQEPELTVPHPRLRERRFALVPLLEIFPEAADPCDGTLYRAVLERLDDGKKVTKSATRES
ncbi:MAG: 2-amino-4-hydroxy-6-hydroxymethyldihydropteridine diphosphokinase [Candidatus Bipolaricaulota bacterium]